MESNHDPASSPKPPPLDYRPQGPGSGRPVPMSARALALITGAVGTTVVAGGVFFLVAPSLTGRCAGATRSTRLRWEQQRQEREQEIAQAIASQAMPAGQSEPGKGDE